MWQNEMVLETMQAAMLAGGCAWVMGMIVVLSIPVLQTVGALG